MCPTIPATSMDCFEMGGWVGGWVGGMEEKKKTLRIYVVGWVGGMEKEKVLFEGAIVRGWVGGWVGGYGP